MIKRKNIICGIYKITSPSGKIYIGQSVNINDRFRKYKRYDCEDQQALFNSFKKHGVENHNFEIIHICDINELNDLEIHYSNLFNSTNKYSGLNIRLCGGAKGLHSEETKKKIGLAHKGKIVSEKTKQILRDINKGKHDGKNNNNYGKKMSEELKAKLLSIRIGSVASEETRKKQSESHIGENNHFFNKKHTPESIEKIRNAKKGKPSKIKGILKSEQHRANISKARKIYWENIRQERAIMIF